MFYNKYMLLIQNKTIPTKKFAGLLIIGILCLPFITFLSTKLFAINNATGEPPKIAGSLVVTDRAKEVAQFAKGKGLEIGLNNRLHKNISIITFKQTPDSPKMKGLSSQLGVKVLPDYIYSIASTPNDPKYTEQWNLPKIASGKAWNITKGSKDTTVAVLDTGVLFEQTINGTTYTQPDFPSDRMWTNSGETGPTQLGEACWSGATEDKSINDCDDDENGKVDDWRGWDFMGGWRGNDASCPNYNSPVRYEYPNDPSYLSQDNDPQPYSCDSPSSPSTLNKDHYDGTCAAWTSACYVGHGTSVASVATATTNNNSLIAGINHNASVLNLRVLDGYGTGTTSEIIPAIYYAAEQKADVINMSFATACGDDNFVDEATEDALATATNAGSISIAASGNGGHDENICYPASSKHTIAVGATDKNDTRHNYSNASSKLDVTAPAGVPAANAPSAARDSNYHPDAHGTSLSTSHVSALAALLKTVEPSMSPDAARSYIRNGATKVAGMNGKTFTKEYGYGRINLFNTLHLATGNNSYPYAWEVINKSAYADSGHAQDFTSHISIAPGDFLYLKLRARNNGFNTWQRDWTNVGTAEPQDRASLFQDDTWINQERTTRLSEPSVLPEKIGNFTFSMKAPTATGTYAERFNGVAEGKGWFRNDSVSYAIDVVEPVSPSNTANISLKGGESIKPGGFLLSPDRHSILKLQRDGNLVLYRNLEPVWSTKTRGHGVSKLIMQSDGNLVLYSTSGKALWHSVTYGNSGSYTTIQTDANLVIYDSSDSPLWETATTHYPDGLNLVNKHMQSGFSLHKGQKLQTANRKYRLVFQSDGNIVLYKGGQALWATYTVGKNGETDHAKRWQSGVI